MIFFVLINNHVTDDEITKINYRCVQKTKIYQRIFTKNEIDKIPRPQKYKLRFTLTIILYRICEVPIRDNENLHEDIAAFVYTLQIKICF